MKCSQEILIDDASIIFVLDLAETYSITNSYKRAKNPAYFDGFLFGHGSVSFKWPNGRLERLLGDQEIGNMFVLLEWFSECMQASAKGLRDIGKICPPGRLSEMLRDYLITVEEGKNILNNDEYENLQNCVIESRNFNTISCYTVAGNCYLEVGVNADGDSDIPKLETWCREVIPETLGLELLAARNFFVDSYAQYSTSL